MDNNNNMNRNDNLGVNKFGKNIRKTPIHQPNDNFARPQTLPKVYNINKNDFRNIVQQLTGSPARDQNPRPVISSPKPQSQRLQKIRPPPLNPIARPPLPGPMGQGPIGQAPMGQGLMGPQANYGSNNAFIRPNAQYGQPPNSQYSQPSSMQMANQYPPAGGNIAESPVSLYMRYLQNSITDTGPGPIGQGSMGPGPIGQGPMGPGSIGQGPMGPRQPGPPQFSSVAPGLLPNPPSNRPDHQIPSPRMWGQPLLQSPNSQYLLPSPTGFLNLVSPRSPYPQYQFPPPLSPGFGYPGMNQTQPGLLGPGPQPPVSPGIFFPVSPGGFFPVSSPRWRDHKF